MPVPTHFSRSPVTGLFAWTGAELKRNDSWICQLNSSQIAAIEAGIRTFAETNLGWRSADKNNLPLVGLDDLFNRIRLELEEGSGLFRLRDIPVERYSLEQLKSFYLSFGDHIGQPVSQSLTGQRLMHIEDEGAKSKDYGVIDADGSGKDFRSSRSRALSTGGLHFHTDRCDVVSLICVNQASKG
jgi:hypothetical protein